MHLLQIELFGRNNIYYFTDSCALHFNIIIFSLRLHIKLNGSWDSMDILDALKTLRNEYLFIHVSYLNSANSNSTNSKMK